MAKLEDIKPLSQISGIIPNSQVQIISTVWHGSDAIEVTYKAQDGKVDNQLIYRDDEPRIEVITAGRPWSFDGDGYLFRLVSEAYRIRLAHLFDPVLAIHTSLIEPLPHQITAVYESMLPRQPLRFLLADDPGAGKTIMAGLLIKELVIRGDLQRCMVVCPGNLAEQWQDELYRKFQLPFEILTNDKLEAARTGNWFVENNLIIARLDKLSRNEDLQQLLKVPECRWDLVICDEAHKMSASYFGGEIKYTKRFQLGRLLSTLTRHFLLMTATPHNGKEQDFQLFLSLLDGDRFEGRFRDGVHKVDVSDIMRRMVKEKLLKFDGTQLFPLRKAYTVPYKLSDDEAILYKQVTEYVREQFNRAEALQNDKRAGTVGFALTILQRRLASSPEAIYQSLRRRRERLEKRLRELKLLQRGDFASAVMANVREISNDDLEDIDEAPDVEVEELEEEVLDQATASRTIEELNAEIEILKELEGLAQKVRTSKKDRKWQELSNLLSDIFTPEIIANKLADENDPFGEHEVPRPEYSPSQKLVIFTEHRDTLNYLYQRISTLLGTEKAVVVIHGGIGRQDRYKAQEAFKHDPDVKILVATDAAGEGINLQRAHLMVNYDLPWNPNRIEQRFGRIHRIGQREVCHLWNLVADETREGDVYQRLLEKLEEARRALGGQVFDVLGKVHFEGKSLRELLIEAIRFGESPEVKERLFKRVSDAFDKSHIQELLEEEALAQETMDISNIKRIREDMERAEARRLQPHYIESFFMEAFKRLGGSIRQRENKRYQISNVPASIRNRDRIIGFGDPVMPKYERVVFEKDLIAPQGLPQAAFICPGNSLLDSTIDLVLEQNRDLLRRGSLLVDERDFDDKPRVLFYLEHSIRDATKVKSGDSRVISQRMLYIELDGSGNSRGISYAPYLDYRPRRDDEPDVDEILAMPECSWITRELEQKVLAYAISSVVPEHLAEVKNKKLSLIEKIRAAVKARLTKEIGYWDHRAEDLKAEEQAGKSNAKLNSLEARRRADELQARLQKRMEQLDMEEQITALPPVVMGGVIVVTRGLINRLTSRQVETPAHPVNTQVSAERARSIVIDVERELGFEPVDRELEKLGYDIESKDPLTGRLRFIEVKGRVTGAETITVTKNEILYSFNKPDDFILAIVEFFDDDSHRVHYLRQPFNREPDFGVTSVNYKFSELLSRAEEPF